MDPLSDLIRIRVVSWNDLDPDSSTEGNCMNIRKTVNGTEIKLKMILRKILDEIHYN